jgi:hypothetical protein
MDFLKTHQKDYIPKSWQNYTVEELEWWVKLLTKRASHRIDGDKKEKDLYDAKNYQEMLDKARGQ